MLRLKGDTVSLVGIAPQLLLAVSVAEGVFAKHGVEEIVITSVNDSAHSSTSLHYDGKALDLRTHGIAPDTQDDIANEIKNRLGQDFDVLAEQPGSDNEHIHIEWQPRRR
jgi:hypothetical protein